MNPMPEIETLLKNLRLSGLLDTLFIRNKEAIESKLSFTEFLATLLQDEILRRDQKKFESRFKKAKINGNKTLEQFDFGFNKKINQQQIKDIVTCQFVLEKAPVLNKEVLSKSPWAKSDKYIWENVIKLKNTGHNVNLYNLVVPLPNISSPISI